MPGRFTRPPRRLVVLGGGALAVVLVAVAGVAVVRSVASPDGALARAADASPAQSQRLSFTDWAAVREQVGADLDAASSGAAVQGFLDRAYGSDLTSTSAMVASAAALQDAIGLSPGTVAWEGFSQSTSGAVVTMALDDDDLDSLGDRLVDLGFEAPDTDDGVWDGGADLLAGVDPSISPVFGYAVLLEDEGLVLTSDSPTYLETARAAATGDDDSMLEGVDEVVGASADALSAAVYTGEYACGELAMTRADAADQSAADGLVDRATAEGGEIDPITSFAMTHQPGGGVRTVLGFTDGDSAQENADPRARLASGPAVGQGGDFGDRFELGSVVADGPAVVMDMSPREGQYVVSDLSTGPLLFATC